MTIALDLEVVRVDPQAQTCRARSTNEISLEFELPDTPEVLVGDELRIAEFQMDSDVTVHHARSQQMFRTFIDSKDVHDLRLPASQGSSRTPSLERIGSD